MGRLSKADHLEIDLTARLQAMIDNPLTPQYVVAKSIGTLATLLRRRDKRLQVRAAAAAERRAERQAQEWKPSFHLPDNGRSEQPNGCVNRE
jgi:hypothetical protein